MTRIKIKDLPKDMKVSKNNMRKITGGTYIEDLNDPLATLGDDAEFTYLELQQKTQAENGQFTCISNIMKTKQDTVASSITNIR